VSSSAKASWSAPSDFVDRAVIDRGSIWARLCSAAGSFWISALVWTLRYQPWLPRLVRPVGLRCAWRFSSGMRTNLLLNARRILGESSTPAQREALGRAVLESFFDAIGDIAGACRLSDEQFAARLGGVEGIDNYRRARGLARGAIVVTAHLGAFETGLFALRQHEPRVHVVFRRDALRGFETLRSALRRRLGVIEAPVDEGVACWAALRDALLRNEVVLMQGDRVLPGQRGVAVSFIDGHVMLPPGPVKLALATGAPIVPIFAPRLPDKRVRIVVSEPIVLETHDRSSEVIAHALQRIACVIESQVREHPEQWLTVHRAWCEDASTSAGMTR
jgi:lauroyl/myristoyl acyltransferase